MIEEGDILMKAILFIAFLGGIFICCAIVLSILYYSDPTIRFISLAMGIVGAGLLITPFTRMRVPV
ncbi:MAG: hypothetical protein N3F63_03310 [Thermoplasmata archaeon]|nr:hypothetical protein [Thermoplasmata archaeon]